MSALFPSGFGDLGCWHIPEAQADLFPKDGLSRGWQSWGGCASQWALPHGPGDLFSAWAHNLQFQEDLLQWNYAYCTQRMWNIWAGRALKSPMGSCLLVLGSHLQPPSLGLPHLWMKAPPPPEWCCRNLDVSRWWGKEGRRNGTQAVSVSYGTFHSNWQTRNRTFLGSGSPSNSN